MQRVVARLAAVVALSLLATGCGKLREGIAAYHAGSFEDSARLLKKYADRTARRAPSITLIPDDRTRIEDALGLATQPYFQLWQAYAGSLIGLRRMPDGCHAIAVALRPIAVTRADDGSRVGVFDPKRGEYWSAETLALRSWIITLPCPSHLF